MYPCTHANTPQISYSLPILCVVEIILLPYVGALTDYTPHRKLIWLVGFAATQLMTMLGAIMWHEHVWYECAEGS